MDNFSWIRGKHSFRFGGEFRREHYNQVGNQFARGPFTFQPNATQNPATKTGGDTFADFLLGELYQSEAAVAIASAQFRAQRRGTSILTIPGRSRRRLTLSLGLRYEIDAAVEGHHGQRCSRSTCPYLDIDADRGRQEPLSGIHARRHVHRSVCRHPDPLAEHRTRRDGQLGDRLVQTDSNDFAPRIGICLLARPQVGNPHGRRHVLQPGHRQPALRHGAQYRGPHPVNAELYYPTVWSNALADISGGTANIPSPYAFANQYDRRTPYTMQYLFNVQREFGNELVVGIWLSGIHQSQARVAAGRE